MSAAIRRIAALTVSASTVAVLVVVASSIRPRDWLVGVVVWLAIAWGALPFLHLALTKPIELHALPDQPGSVTTVMYVGDEPADVAYAAIAAASAAGPIVAIVHDEAIVATHVPPHVPVVVRASIEEALSAAASLIDTDAVQLLSAGALPDTATAARAAGLLRDPSIGWIIGVALPFNRDGYAPTARWRLDQRLRRAARAHGAELWEPDAMLVRTSLIHEEALRYGSAVPHDMVHRAGGRWLRAWRAQGHRGVATTAAVAVWSVPVSPRWYWKDAVLRARGVVADLADAGSRRGTPGRWFSCALLVRELYAWSFGLLLLSPVLMQRPYGFPFDRSPTVLLAMVATTGALRWATLRWVHDEPLHPFEDVLGAAYDAPGSALAVGAAIHRRVRPTVIPLPPRPLAWIAILLALAMVLSVMQSAGTPGRTAIVVMALTELALLWLFAMQGVLQLLQVRSTYRLSADLTVDVGRQRARTSFLSPTGFGLRDALSLGPPGTSIPVGLHLDDGTILRAEAVITRDERDETADVFELVHDEGVAGAWAAQVGRIAFASVGGRSRRVGWRRARRREPLSPRRVVGDATTLTTAVLAAVAGAVLLLLVFDYHPRIVRSDSMEPALRVGDVVLVHHLPAEKLEVGDIATIDLDGDGGTTHRVHGVTVLGEGLLIETQGDASPTGEQWRLHASATVGRVDRRIPFVGLPLAWLASSPVRPHLVRTALSLAVVAVVWALVARRRARSSRAVSSARSPDAASVRFSVEFVPRSGTNSCQKRTSGADAIRSGRRARRRRGGRGGRR